MNGEKTMGAVVMSGHGGADKLRYCADWPMPKVGEGRALIKVGACGLNNTDVNTRVGWYAKSARGGTLGDSQQADDGDNGGWGGAAIQFPRIQGADVCGVVEKVGDGGDKNLIGKRVLIDPWLRDWDSPAHLGCVGYFGSECDGGFADYTAADCRHLHPIDSSLSDAELATYATSYSTAENMLTRADIKKGDTVLVTGASGGVGAALIQLINRRGGRAVAVCSRDKAEKVLAVGAAAALPRTSENFADDLHSAIGQKTVSAVADVVGGAMWPQWVDAIERGGRYVCSGAIAGAQVAFDLRPFYLGDLTFVGATAQPPGLFAKLVGHIQRGEVPPLLAATYPLEKFHEAQAMFLQKEHVGNIVVCP